MPRVTDEHRQQRREQLLDAARRCFVRQGFHATSMQDVLAEAGMSAGAAYGYFSSKDDIILAVAEENMTQVAAALRLIAADAEQTPATALAEIFELIRSENAKNDFAKVAVIVWSEAIRNQALRARLSDLGQQYRKTFAKLASSGRHRPSAADRSVASAATALVTGYILQLAVEERAPADLAKGFEALAN